MSDETTTKQHTYDEVARDWRLWITYADPADIDTREDWDKLSIAERIEMLTACFGPEGTA